MTEKKTNRYAQNLIITEISFFSRYFGKIVFSNTEDQYFSDTINKNHKEKGLSYENNTAVKQNLNDLPTLYILNKDLNFDPDITENLKKICKDIKRDDRICFIVINPYLRFFTRFLGFFSKSNKPAINFTTRNTLKSICELNDLQILSIRNTVFIPFHLGGLGDQVNSILSAIPLIRWLSFSCIITARPKKSAENKPKMSVIVPARNESGNIDETVRLLNLSKFVSGIIFVEGGSSDDTASKIEEAKSLSAIPIQLHKQEGKGKAEAVKLGFKLAKYELLFILDADLTVLPGEVDNFYKSYVDGLGDFINGNRLLYPMEQNAMRPLNFIANIFFAKALSYVLNISIGDSLCGSKLISKNNYLRIERWRESFGDFDPFGDFDLLFGASILKLGVFDLPVQYKARKYGKTNIHRFRDGFALLRMLFVGFSKIKLGKRSKIDA